MLYFIISPVLCQIGTDCIYVLSNAILQIIGGFVFCHVFYFKIKINATTVVITFKELHKLKLLFFLLCIIYIIFIFKT